MPEPDTSIKDTYKGELDTFVGIFSSASQKEFAHTAFEAGAHSVLLLLMKGMKDCSDVSDVVDNLQRIALDVRKHCSETVKGATDAL